MKRCWKPQQNPPKLFDDILDDVIMKRLRRKYSHAPWRSDVMIKQEPVTPDSGQHIHQDSRFNVLHTGCSLLSNCNNILEQDTDQYFVSLCDMKSEISPTGQSIENTTSASDEKWLAPGFQNEQRFQPVSHLSTTNERKQAFIPSYDMFVWKQMARQDSDICSNLPRTPRGMNNTGMDTPPQELMTMKRLRTLSSQQSRWAEFDEAEVGVQYSGESLPLRMNISPWSLQGERCHFIQSDRYSGDRFSSGNGGVCTHNSRTTSSSQIQVDHQSTSFRERGLQASQSSYGSNCETISLPPGSRKPGFFADKGRNTCEQALYSADTVTAATGNTNVKGREMNCSSSVGGKNATCFTPWTNMDQTGTCDAKLMPEIESSKSRIQQMLKTFSDEKDERKENKILHENQMGATESSLRQTTEQESPTITNVANLGRDEQLQLMDEFMASRLTGWLLLFQDNSTSSNLSTSRHGTHVLKGLLLHVDARTYLLPLDCEPEVLVWIRSVITSILQNDRITKVAVNCKHLVIALLRDFAVGNDREASQWQFEDPLVAGWLLRPDKPPETLQDLCSVAGIDPHPSGSLDAQLDSELVVMMGVMERLRGQVMEQRLWQLFVCVEMPLTPLLAVMELQAIKIDVQAFVHFSDVLKKKLARLERKAHELAGHPFCINSTQQLRQLLYEELRLDQQLPVHSKVTLTATAHHKSTSEPMLRQLMTVHPLPAVILEHRQLLKLKSTYIDGIMEIMVGGVLKTHWDQTAAATGRLTSAQPNLQAIPKAPTVISDFQENYIVGTDAEKVEIYAREPYISNEGNVFLSADFQQIELRILAHLTDDMRLKEIFQAPHGADVFIQLTAQWLGKKPDEVSGKEREQTKRVVYSVMYGVGKDRLAEYLKVSPSRAKDIMDSFLVTFPAINGFTRRCIDYAKHHGYTESIMGRRRWVPNINHHTPQARAQAERQAVNFCVQGSAADVCKCAMLKVEQALYNRPHLSARLLIHIHDELLWELPTDQLKETHDLIQGVMKDVSLCQPILQSLRVPLTVSMSTGTSWAHLSPYQ